jgi:hypothetical protein
MPLTPLKSLLPALAVLLMPLLLPAMAAAQQETEDGASIDAIVDAAYDVISGPAGEARDWDRFRALFAEGAKLYPRVTGMPQGLRPSTPEDYVARSGPLLEERGFFEGEVARSVHRYGDVAQVFSTYEGRWKENEAPFIRGVNAFQLVFDGERWWIVSLAWQQEAPELPVPAAYEAE